MNQELRISKPGIQLSDALIDSYIAELARRGRTAGTIQAYRRKLLRFYAALPEDKLVEQGTLRAVRDAMKEEGHSHASINLLCSAANGLLDYCGRRDLQMSNALAPADVTPPELSRTEYLRLLSTARLLERERPYLLVKTFVNTGIYSRELELLTVEAVRAGVIVPAGREPVRLSPPFREELLDYCRRCGLSDGPVFVTGGGTPLLRAAVNSEIKRLAEDACVPASHCTPFSLRRLYLSTREQIFAPLFLLAEQEHDRLLESEQAAIGWRQDAAVQPQHVLLSKS